MYCNVYKHDEPIPNPQQDVQSQEVQMIANVLSKKLLRKMELIRVGRDVLFVDCLLKSDKTKMENGDTA